MDLKDLQKKVEQAKASVKRNKAKLKTIDKDSPKYDSCKRAIKGAETRLKKAKAELADAKPKSKIRQMASKISEKMYIKGIALRTTTAIVGVFTAIGLAVAYKVFNASDETAEPTTKDSVAA